MAFVNFQRLLDANDGKGDEMADKALQDSGANQALGAAEGAARSRAQGLHDGSQGDALMGAQAKMQTLQNGGSQAAIHGNALDGALMGQSQTMQAAQARASNLSKLMANAQGAYDARQRQTAADANYRGNIADADGKQAARRQAEQRTTDASGADGGFTNMDARWRGGYQPRTPAEYAAYSNWIKSGRR